MTYDAEGGVAEGAWHLAVRPDGPVRARRLALFQHPKGTPIDYSLVLRHTGRNARLGAEHYQIEVRTGGMPVEAFKGALDNLAARGVAKL